MLPINSYDPVAPYYDALFEHWISKEATEKELTFIMQNAAPMSTILDVGCGTGRHLIPLVQKGYSVTGVEPSEGQVQELLKKLPTANIFVGVLDKFDSLEKFDLIICMYNAFTEISFTEEQAISFLTECKKRLKPGGKIFLDVGGIDSSDDTSGFNFTETVNTPTHSITLTWKVQSYDSENHITECLETYVIRNLKDNSVEKYNNIEKQKWWKRNEFEKLAQAIGMNMDVHVVGSDSSHQANIVILRPFPNY